MGLSTTQKLLKAWGSGQAIVCRYPPYAGVAAAYRPRSKYDNQPWVVNGYRYAGHELKAIDQESD